MKLAQPDHDALALQERKQQLKEKNELLRVCKEMDINQDGYLDKNEFARYLKHGKLGAYLSVLGLDIREAEVFLKVLTKAAADAPIHIEDFVEGCLRMKGTATSLDMQALIFETKLIRRQF